MDNPHDMNGAPGERSRAVQVSPTGWRDLVIVVESLTEAFYTLDSQWCFTYLNAQAEVSLGRSRTQLLGKCIWDECPQMRGTAYETQIRLAVEQSVPCAFELYDTPRKKWKELHVFPSGQGLAVSCIDTTERKLREDVERNDTLRFQVVARVTTDVIFDWDIASDHVWWSDGLRTVFGYDSPDCASTLQGWADHVHPDERRQVFASFSMALRGSGESWTGEYRFLRKNGSYADVYANTTIVRAPDGEAIRAIGAMVDVTEKRRAAAERMRNEARIGM